MYSVAIDGPAGSGKSTIAKLLAKELNISYVDTGAMYRAIALKTKEENLDTEEKLRQALKSIDIDFHEDRIFLDDEDVSDKIRTEEISKIASNISKLDFVRDMLVSIQQNIASKKPVVMEGRDIGTVVLKDSKYKFFLTASIDSRVNRRHNQNLERGIESSIEELREDIIKRDYNDTHRENSPLIQAEDAILIDNSNLNLEDNVEIMLKYIRGE